MSCKVLKNYDYAITGNYGNGHTGVDIVGVKNVAHVTDDVVAHSSGKVIFCQKGQVHNPGSTGNASYGNCVKIRHDNGMFTLYAHLANVDVSIGQYVSAGQKIGHMGNTGNSYGAHLHFEVWNSNNIRINPEPYLNKGFEENTTTFAPGTYKVTATLLNVRTGAGLGYAKKTAVQLTQNAQEQNGKLGNSKANGLLQNCIVDVSAIIKDNNYIWGKIPSGYICLQENGEDYVVKM